MSRCNNGPLEKVGRALDCGDTSPLSAGETCLPVRAVVHDVRSAPPFIKTRVH